MEKLVLPVRKGGLGNQMFQVAAAIVYSFETGRLLVLPKEFYNAHNKSGQDYGDTIFRFAENRLNVVMDQIAIDNLISSGWTIHPREPGYEFWQPDMSLRGNVILHGYFQSYPAISKYEKVIQSIYLTTLSKYVSKIKENDNRVGIHVQNMTYYTAAIERVKRETNTQYHIFSDDIEWCKKQPFFASLPGVEFVDEPDECLTLARMAECHGGFICANSTFSWWGAFLGAHSVGAPCVVPSRWFKGAEVHLFPQSWIVI
jgi:hypothetical protein